MSAKKCFVRDDIASGLVVGFQAPGLEGGAGGLDPRPKPNIRLDTHIAHIEHTAHRTKTGARAGTPKTEPSSRSGNGKHMHMHRAELLCENRKYTSWWRKPMRICGL